MTEKQLSLFKDEPQGVKVEKAKSKAEIYTDYEGFVSKFKDAPKTTDDCFTPQNIYEAVVDFVQRRAETPFTRILRPFYPGGDYEKASYPDGYAVIDNPPFSILTKIVRFYVARKIPFFIFAPHLTIFGSKINDVTYFPVGIQIVYANGAVVSTSFISNMFGNKLVWASSELYEVVKNENDKNLQEAKANLPKYEYNDNVLTQQRCHKLAADGEDFIVNRDEAVLISKLDAQKQSGKAIFGCAALISNEKAMERVGGKVIKWDLSEREKRIVAQLGK